MAERRQGCRPFRVPLAIGLRTNLVGTDEMTRDRPRLYRDAGGNTLRVRANLWDDTAQRVQGAACGGGVSGGVDARIDDLARLLDILKAVNEECPARDVRTSAS